MKAITPARLKRLEAARDGKLYRQGLGVTATYYVGRPGCSSGRERVMAPIVRELEKAGYIEWVEGKSEFEWQTRHDARITEAGRAALIAPEGVKR